VHAAPTSTSRLVRILTVVALVAATVGAFIGVLNCGWLIYDDGTYVTTNHAIARGFTASGVEWVLTSVHGGNWHPLTSFSHMLDVELFGLDPRGPHAVNLALHTINVVLVLWALFAYAGAWWRSALVAAPP